MEISRRRTVADVLGLSVLALSLLFPSVLALSGARRSRAESRVTAGLHGVLALSGARQSRAESK